MHRPVVPIVAAVFGLLVAAAGPATANHDATATADDPVSARGVVQSGPPQVTYTYEVTTEGSVQTDLGAFAATARSLLSDARGWTLGGSVAFEPVRSGGDFTLVVASPPVIEQAAPVCSRRYSCQVGDRVYINDVNWREGTSQWNATGAPLSRYREYLVNHELGHFLEFDHVGCPGDGQLAPVMMQQSKGVDGCRPSGWPLESERDQLAQRLGVPVYDWVFPDVLVTYEHREAIHALAERGIVEGFADGWFRPQHEVTRGQLASYLARTFGLEAEDPPPFDDVDPAGTHADAIAAAAEAGIVRGYEDGTFEPSGATSRAQMATMLARAYELEASADPDFEDVPPDHPHAEGIAAVAEAGLARGYADGTYRPQTDVDRGQMAAFIARGEGES